jgi:hypothetical protein
MKIQGDGQTENYIKENLKRKKQIKNLIFYFFFLFFRFLIFNFLFLYNFMKIIFVIGGTLILFDSLIMMVH